MGIVGRVVSGIGEGRKFFSLDGYNIGFEKLLGVAPFAGTLNVDVGEGSIDTVEKIKNEATLNIAGFEFEGKKYFDVKCSRAKLNGVEGLLVFPLLNHHSKNILEFVCSINLREKFGFRDGDEVEIV